MEAVQKNTEYPEYFRWKGIRFDKKPPPRNEEVRYESWSPYAWAMLYPNGQWMAAFIDGVYSIEWSLELALVSALRKKIDHLYYQVGEAEALLELAES